MPQRHAPATARNRDVILTLLQRHLPEAGTVLEIASGSGEHAVYFAPTLAPRLWQPSDINPDNVASINAWRADYPSDNLLAAITLDVSENPWTIEQYPMATAVTAIVSINMIHIAPWACCEGLLAGSERLLASGGLVYLYGPFIRDGVPTSASNAAFHQQLTQQNPAWGLRHLDSVIALAENHRLDCIEVVDMHANNLSVIFKAR